ncbi:hypothetical protein B0A52_01653 [Exophiala mesophila]|uniref:F-box domain-containing protein n=1 Tax=Exophiala mesophila TaxID=212818 RepID=A0A438NFM2_EXOME|nr:hypothetical protein B0A52_01653 [Exophiala mesophila]
MFIEDSLDSAAVPISLFDLLSNSIVLDQTVPYLPCSSLFALARTCHSIRDLLFSTPSVFRSVDLSRCRGAYINPELLTRIDSGGNSWRAERIDEHLTEDEFYAGPLRGVLWKLGRMRVLQRVHTLILDGLASVTQDLVSDLVSDPQYAVTILSIRRCLNVNPSKLQQLLRLICRPTRPAGTPRLKGLYYFTQPSSSLKLTDVDGPTTRGVTLSEGAQLGASPTSAHVNPDTIDPWYTAAGQVISIGHGERTSWEETLQTCHGIISFDAVLCTHMHADMEPVLHGASRDFLMQNKPGIAPMATIVLGPSGCASCGRHPRGGPVWGESDVHEFPLIWPPPASGRLVDAVRPPLRMTSDGRQLKQHLTVSCTWCLTNRHCDNCHRWWCSDCYNPGRTKKLEDLERLSQAGLRYLPSLEELCTGVGEDHGDRIKVFNGLCVENCLVSEWMAGAGGGGMWG